ncbi:MAG: leucine-rich repeat protein, partial [Muribaculaceae bacterium]|nr:leucine-rich repeat protein [Muribaculaceae bacterium]
AQSWISVVPDTRAMEKRSITLKLEPNEGHDRSATVTIQSKDGSVKLGYLIEQKGELGVAIDPEAVPDDEIWYTSIDGKVIELYKSGYDMFGATLVSNTYINGKGVLKFNAPVTSFGSKAEILGNMPFGAAGAGTPEKLLAIYLPHTVKTLGWCALAYCNNLTNIGMPRNLEYIGGDVFLECRSLTYINLPAAVNFIGDAAFGGCVSLEIFDGECQYISKDKRSIIIDGVLNAVAPAGLATFTIPNNVSIIGPYTFIGVSTIEDVIIPNSVIEIELRAFDGCSGLKEINLPNSIKKIGDTAFRGIKASTIYIPESVEYIGNGAFNDCDNLISFTGKFASEDGKMLIVNSKIISTVKKGLVNLVIPSNVQIIGANIFNGIETLETVTISEGVEIIDIQAFAYNNNLRSINIPNSAIGFGAGIVHGCLNLEKITGKYTTDDNRCLIVEGVLNSFAPANLTEYTLPDDVKIIGSMAFSDGFPLKTINLPEGLITIADRAFSYGSLETVILPSTLRFLYNDSFYGNKSLKDIYCKSFFPPEFINCEGRWDSVFGDIHPNATIYVPKTRVDEYKRSWPWYSTIIEGYDFDTTQPDYYYSTDYSQDGKVVTLQKAAKGNGIDVVLMGDAFSDRQVADGTYMKAMRAMADNLFTEEPYKSFKDMFNVYVVNVVSATEGYEYGNTALSGYFGGGTLVGGNDNRCFEYALNAISEERMDEALIVVAMNEDAYAGTCWMYYPYGNSTYGSGPSVAYFPTSSDTATFAQLLHHEACGHGFSKLADEYDYGTTISAEEVAATKAQQNDWGWWKNVDFTGDPSAVRWNYFLSDSRYANDGLGVFQGGLTHSFGVWRPTDNSIMRYNTGGFNAPSREAIYYRIHKLAYGDSWQYNYEDFVKYDEINRKAAAPARVYAPSTYTPTHPPVVVNKSWRDAK